jgi:hypothetical protein
MKFRLPLDQSTYVTSSEVVFPCNDGYPNGIFFEDKRNTAWIRKTGKRSHTLTLPAGTRLKFIHLSISSRSTQQVGFFVNEQRQRSKKSDIPVGKIYLTSKTLAMIDMMPLYTGPKIVFEDDE